MYVQKCELLVDSLCAEAIEAVKAPAAFSHSPTVSVNLVSRRNYIRGYAFVTSGGIGQSGRRSGFPRVLELWSKIGGS
jgi:hypothetical protein